MNILRAELSLPVWITFSLCVAAHEVTVRESDLQLCRNSKMCVTEPKDCDPQPSTHTPETLNISCLFLTSPASLTCGWSRESEVSSHVSLIFSSKHHKNRHSCRGLFNALQLLTLTVRWRDHSGGGDVWSQPHHIDLYNILKPTQPELRVLNATADSLLLSWSSIDGDAGCRLRYRADPAPLWTQGPEVPDQTLVFALTHLLPLTTYRAAVACRAESGLWSDWSTDVMATTRERVPSRPPEVCYRVESPDPGGPTSVVLEWEDLNLQEAGGRLLGYQLSYPSGREQLIPKVTEGGVRLLVEEGNHSVTVQAFNSAGYGPAAQVGLDGRSPPPPVSSLWLSSRPAMTGFLVQWENPAPPPTPPVSHVVVRWRSESRPSDSGWTTVERLHSSALITDINPDDSYLVSVFPVRHLQCGAARSLRANLQQGALIEACDLRVVEVNKSAVTVQWAWQRVPGHGRGRGLGRVERYSVMLLSHSGSRRLPLSPDQQQLTFLTLEPNTQYSVILLADNVSTSTVPITTEDDQLPVVAPVLLLVLVVLVVSILSRTLFRSLFFPSVSSPRSSSAGRWLMNPETSAEMNILDMNAFLVSDLLGDGSLIVVGPPLPSMQPRPLPSEDAARLSLSQLIIQQDLHLDRGLDSSQSHYEEEEERPLTGGGMARLSSALQRQTGSSKLTCETDYIANSCFPARTTEEEQS